MNSFREIPIEKKENFFNQESHTRHFKIQLFELESQLKTLANNNPSAKNTWKICQKLSNLCLKHSHFLYKSNEISKAEVYIFRAIYFTEYDENYTKIWLKQLDFQKIRLEISHVFSMIFKHKKENLTGYTTLQKLTSTLDFTVFESNLHKYLAGVDVLFKNLALFAYKLEHYEEVIEISVNFAKELNDFLANKKDLDKFKLKAILKSVNFYDDFIIQKKIILSYFYYLLSKSYEKLKEDDNALDNIKFALEALEDKTHDDKTHDYYKKYNSFFQLIINQMALKHSLDINYDDFKRNLQELDEKNQKQQECSIDFKEKSSFKHLKKEILKNPIGKDNSNAFFKKKKPLAKFLMIAEALPQNKVFFERQKLFNQSLHNCSTTIRNSGSYSIIKSKPSSFHQKFDLSYQKTSMKPSIRFPIDMKSLLLKRPKSANQSNSKHDEKLKKNKKNNNNDNDNDKEKNKNFYEKDREKIRFKEKNNEKHNKNFKDQEFHEKKAALNAEDSIFKVKKNSKNMNEQLSKPTTPQSHSNRKNNQQNLTPDLQPLFHKKLKKAFSTKFNLHEKPKVSSKSFLPNNSRSMNRRYTERPDSFPPKKPELLKLGQNPGHHRFSSMGVSLINYTVVSSNKSPGISSSHVKKASGSVFSNSIESNSEEEVMSGEEETKKDIKNTLPLKLPTISNVGSEETPLNREKNKCEMSLHSYEMETPKEIKSEYNIPFIKVIFSWVLLKKRKEKFEKDLLQKLTKMPFGIFFGSEFEFFREKLQKILNGIHNPFWFFSKPPGNTSTYFWKVLKIVTQLRKEEGFTENETEDFIWNAKGLELRVLIYLDNSRYKGPYLVLDLREKLESFSEMFQEVNQAQNEYFYYFVDIVLSRFLKKWEVKEIDKNKVKKKISSEQQEIFNKSSLFESNEISFDSKDAKTKKKISIDRNIKEEKNSNSSSSEFCFQDSKINSIYEKLSYIISNLIIMKRKPSGFAWSFRNNPKLIQEEKNFEILIQKNKAHSKNEIARKAIFRKPMKLFPVKERKATGVLSIFKGADLLSKTSIQASKAYFKSRNSFLKAMQKNTKNSLLNDLKKYQTKGNIINNESILNFSTIKNNFLRKNTLGAGNCLAIENNEIFSPPKNLVRAETENLTSLLNEIRFYERKDLEGNNRDFDENNKNIMINGINLEENIVNACDNKFNLKENTMKLGENEIGIAARNIDLNENSINLLENSLDINKERMNKLVTDLLPKEKNLRKSVFSSTKLNNLDEEKTKKTVKKSILKKKMSNNSLFPVIPYDFDGNEEIYYLNPFKENEIILQGVFWEEPSKNWRFFTLSIGFSDQMQHFCKFLKKNESSILLKKMKDYSLMINVYNISNTKKIIYFSTHSFDNFLKDFLSISSLDEKLHIFQKLNLYGDFPWTIQKNLLFALQKLKRKEEKIITQNFTKSEDIPANTFSYTPFGTKISAYFYGKLHSSKIFLRIQIYNFFMVLSVYNPLKQNSDYHKITNASDILKLQNLMKLKNKVFQWKILLFHISFQRNLVGTKLYFNRKDSENINNSNIKSFNYKPSDLLAVVQHPFLRNHYRNQTYFELFQIKSIGKCYIKIRIFYPLSEEASKDFIKVKCEFFPLNSRCKILKLVMSYRDIVQIFDKELIFTNVRNLLNDFNRIIFPRIVLFKENLQYKLAISDGTPLQNYRMDFSIDKKQIENNSGSILKLKKLKYKCVCQLVKKIKGFFAVFTIKQHLYLDFWTILIYFPHSNRTFSSTIYLYELLNFSKNFWRCFLLSKSSMSPRKSNSKEHKKSLEENSFPPNLKCIGQKDLPPININELLCLFKIDYSDLKKELKKICKSIKPSSLLSHIAKKTNYTFIWGKSQKEGLKNNNLEILFWEEFLRLGNIDHRKLDKFVLNVDKYRGVIREILIEKLEEKSPDLIFYQLHFEKKQNLVLDANSIEIKNKNLGMFDHLEGKTYSNPNCVRFYARAIDLKTLIRVNYRYEGNNSTQGFKGITREFEENPELFLLKMKKSYKPQMNKKGVEGWEVGGEIFLYKGVLLGKNRVLITLIYLKKKNEIVIKLFDQKTGIKDTKKIKVIKLEGILSLIRIFIKAKEYKILGEILVKLLKNTLILYLFKRDY